jgi:hypothetical protein
VAGAERKRLATDRPDAIAPAALVGQHAQFRHVDRQQGVIRGVSRGVISGVRLSCAPSLDVERPGQRRNDPYVEPAD